MISPEGITVNSDTYNSVLNKVNETYSDKKIDYLQADLEDLENEMPVIRDISCYEKALNVVGGILVSLARDNIEGLFFIPNFILDELFGTNNNKNMERYFNNLEEDLINIVVTDKQSYYYGKAVGNAICVAEGIICTIAGAITLVGGVTINAIGIVASATGVGFVVRGVAIAISILAVATGTTLVSAGGNMMYSSANNFKENISEAKEVKVEVDDIKLKEDIKKLDDDISEYEKGISKIDEQIIKPTGRMNMAGKTHPVSGVEFDDSGFPKFKSKYNMNLDPEDYLKSRGAHFDRASKSLYNEIQNNSELASKFTQNEINIFKEGGVPKRFTWHHNQEPGLMQLVDRGIHRQTGHEGGFSIWGPGNK